MEDSTADKKFCLEVTAASGYQLKRTHQYYYQVNLNHFWVVMIQLWCTACMHVYSVFTAIACSIRNPSCRSNGSCCVLTRISVILYCGRMKICMWNAYGHQKSSRLNVLRNVNRSLPLPSFLNYSGNSILALHSRNHTVVNSSLL